MKTTIVRAFVVALALTGAFAVSHAAPTAKASVAPAHLQNLPVPSCDPNDPSCSLGG
jgi:Spy/CpxP family protein refolding chaperone